MTVRLARRTLLAMTVASAASFALPTQAFEILGVVGDSGSGKSTLARMILRLTEPTSGSIRFEDSEITELSPREMLLARRDMQMVFQNPHSATSRPPHWISRCRQRCWISSRSCGPR